MLSDITLAAATSQPVPVVGLIAYVFAAVGAVVTALVVLAGTALSGYSARSVATGVGGVVGAVGVAGGTWMVVYEGLSTAVGVAGVLGLAGILLLVVPVGVGTVGLSRFTDAADPVGYAVLGVPVVVPVPLAYLRTVQPPSGSPLLTVLLFGVPAVGPAVVGYAVYRLTR